MGKDECRNALIAAMNVLSEECKGKGSIIKVGPEDTLLYVPEEVERLREEAGNPVTEEEAKELMEESPWLGNWASAMCRISGVSPEEEPEEFESCKMTWAMRALRPG